MGWILILVVLLYLFASLRVLKQYERGVVFFLAASPRCASRD
jgi:regulator of protease activity HflC (stomatin/prohibitin superfamily)